MKKILVLTLAIGLVAEMGEALERDAGVEAVAWEDLVNAIPTEVDGTRLSETESDESSDRVGQACRLRMPTSWFAGTALLWESRIWARCAVAPCSCSGGLRPSLVETTGMVNSKRSKWPGIR